MPREKRPPVVHVDEIAHRYSSYDTPFWARENTQPGRWHERGHGPAQYLSLSTDGAWAELIRNEELTTEDEVAMVSVQMWAVAVDQAMIIDYSTFERAEAAGFDPEALVDERYGRCQQEGARLRQLGFSGVLAPRARWPAPFSGRRSVASRATSFAGPDRAATPRTARRRGLGRPP